MTGNNSPWFTVREAASYTKVSPRTVESWLKDGLRHSRINRTIRIHRDWLDAFLTSFSEENTVRVDAIVREIEQEMKR